MTSGRRPPPPAIAAIALAASLLGPAACGGEGPRPSGSTARPGGEIVVFAAASLTESFTEIGQELRDRSGIEATFNFASSSDLAVQITEGAPADLYASADEVQMSVVEENGLAENPVDFVTNRLVVLAPADNPAGIHSPDDLARSGVKVVLAAPEVPAGNYARRAFEQLGLDVEGNVVSNEDDVKQVLTKVRLGEADAGVVYITDVTDEVAGDVTAIEFPSEAQVEVVYPMTVVDGASNPGAAQAFYDFVLSDDGRRILESYGFGTP